MITNILSERYGIQSAPGKRCECPECDHKSSFTIMKSNKFGRCWRPICGFALHARHDMYSVAAVLDSLAWHWHKALVAGLDPAIPPSDPRVSIACKYLLEARRLHPRVIHDYPIGIVPANFKVDITSAFQPAINHYKTADIASNTDTPDKHTAPETLDIPDAQTSQPAPATPNESGSNESPASPASESSASSTSSSTKKRGRGRPAKNSQSSQQQQQSSQQSDNTKLFELIETRDLLIAAASHYSGMLALFFHDPTGEISLVKFRSPAETEKRCNTFRVPGHKSHGLFGAQIFDHTATHGTELDSVFIVEGEFNLLSLQSLILRARPELNDIDDQIIYVRCAAIGSATNPDYDAITALNLPIIYIPDQDESGLKVVSDAAERHHCRVVTLPPALPAELVPPDFPDAADRPIKDLDDFVSIADRPNYHKYSSATPPAAGLHDDPLAATATLIQLRTLITTAHRQYRSLAPVVADIEAIRKSKKHKLDIEKTIQSILLSDMLERGKFYYEPLTKTPYYFSSQNLSLIPLISERGPISALFHSYGLNWSAQFTAAMFSSIYETAIATGLRVSIRQTSYYDNTANILYIFDHRCQIFRVSATSISLVPNGTDGVLFLADPNNEQINLTTLPSAPTPATPLLDAAILHHINFNTEENMLSDTESQDVIRTWFFAYLFRTLLPTKPFLLFYGEKGSGKSTTLRSLGQLLFGARWNVTAMPDDPKNFDSMVINNNFVGLDNVDSNSSWLNDKLALCATGGKIEFRKLYASIQEIHFLDLFIGITARTPKFRRDDVADRIIPLRVNRLNKFLFEIDINKKISNLRSDIWSEILSHAQCIVQNLALPTQHSDANFRMADFAGFAFRAYPEHFDHFTSIFKKLSNSQAFFNLENSPIFNLLQLWANDPNNFGRRVTARELYTDFTQLAENYCIDLGKKTTTESFSRNFKNSKSSLSEFFLIKQYKNQHSRLLQYEISNIDGLIDGKIPESYPIVQNNLDFSNNSENINPENSGLDCDDYFDENQTRH